MLFGTLECSLFYNICFKCAHRSMSYLSEWPSLYQWKYILFSSFRILGLPHLSLLIFLRLKSNAPFAEFIVMASTLNLTYGNHSR